jgi:hypothetical protein
MNGVRANRSTTALDSFDHRHNRSRNFLNTPSQGNLFQFFIKPHLAVVGIESRKQIIRYSLGARDGETEACFWSLRVKNRYGRISKSVKDGIAYLYFSSIGKELTMKWNVGPLLYFDEKWVRPEGEKAQFVHYNTVENIKRQASAVGDIPAGETRLLYFLVTFKDSNFAYILFDFDEYCGMTVGEDAVHGVSNIPLRFPLDESNEFLLRFEGEDRGNKHIVHLLSYDDIRLD